MATILGDLVPSLKREVNLPGSSLFPDATSGNYEGYLLDAFWELTMLGVLSGHDETDGEVTPDLGRDYQQLIVMAAGIRILRNKMIEIDTTFRAKAGPVEFETQKAASVLKGVLDALTARFDAAVAQLPNTYKGSTIDYIDPIYEREFGYIGGYSTFVGY